MIPAILSNFRKTALSAIAIAMFLTASASLQAQTGSASAATPESDAWRPLQFLVGNWEAKTEGAGTVAEAAGSYSFEPELKGHILARNSRTASCKAPASFDCEHGDLLYIYTDAPGQPYKAIYFDNEGHVLHYAVTTPTPTSVIFATDASTPGPQFRLSYELKDGIMSGKFQGKMPGQPDFQSYLEWSGKKK